MKIFNNFIKKLEFFNILISTLGILSCLPYLYFSDIVSLLGKPGVVIATFFLLCSYFILGYVHGTYERLTLHACRARMVSSDVNKSLYRFISILFLFLTLAALFNLVDLNYGVTSFYCAAFLYVSKMCKLKAESYSALIDRLVSF